MLPIIELVGEDIAGTIRGRTVALVGRNRDEDVEELLSMGARGVVEVDSISHGRYDLLLCLNPAVLLSAPDWILGELQRHVKPRGELLLCFDRYDNGQFAIDHFESWCETGPLAVATREFVPAFGLGLVHFHLTREWTTQIVRCVMVKGREVVEAQPYALPLAA